MAEKIATREAYGKALAEFGAEYENLVVLDADLAAATKTGRHSLRDSLTAVSLRTT